LQIGGLPAAVEELGTSAQRLFGIPCETECDPTIEVADEDTAIHLYRVAQEAITNAAKHGGPPVHVALRQVNGLIELEVRDQGVGFDPDKHGYQGVGLNIMAYRAQRAGAKLIIQSAPNKGTSVRCTLAKGVAHA
jgi:signal transduction histidine kinase